ncbi:hypothetical protein [Aeromicrobium terrae]|uniref:Uncharacterized protein n=1 Tax=Aeromicrobium terrae TaxID=2498846 RepID=A0A5C8NI33_9ACTN|nr:hypothetical protein [Aeromicrobium terrae]TXL60832.1 hypothetical protein FHP06_10435 [Aeromicrobium terrae]
MSATCDDAADALTQQLGFSCHDVSTVVSVRDPFDLYSWTQPVLEVLIIGGAIFALVHAVRRYRQGDPINLALWFASLCYLAVTEPPLYFPEWFGLDDIYGFIFAHNEFTVQFMYDRLPLYIVAFYPAITALAYEVVRGFGIFARRGPLVGAVCVAFVSQVFYEIFDHLGPQLKWWAWNDDNQDVSHPMFASVPMTSMLLFASVSLAFMTYLVLRLVGDGKQRSGGSIAWRTVVAGVLTPLGMLVGGIPSGIFGGDSPNHTAQAWVIGIELGLVWLVGGWLLFRDAREPATEPLSRFAAIFPAAFLVAHAVFWLSALPDFLDAADGLTVEGTPIGSGWYVIACFVASTAVLVALYRTRRRVPVTA